MPFNELSSFLSSHETQLNHNQMVDCTSNLIVANPNQQTTFPTIVVEEDIEEVEHRSLAQMVEVRLPEEGPTIVGSKIHVPFVSRRITHHTSIRSKDKLQQHSASNALKLHRRNLHLPTWSPCHPLQQAIGEPGHLPGQMCDTWI